MSNVNVSISVDDKHMNRIPEVVKNLQAGGMKVEQSMEQLGIVIGSIDSTKVEALSQVEGVSHIERSREYQLAPPEKDIQ